MRENSSDFTNKQSPQGGAFSRDLLDQKSKSLLFPGPGGPWLQMTGALLPSILVNTEEAMVLSGHERKIVDQALN